MVAIIVSWLVILFILISFGDITITLYRKVCKQEEEYNLPDTFILGLCLLSAPLGFWSIWMPSNHNFLLIAFVLSIVYWCLYQKRLLKRIHILRSKIKSLPLSAFICIGIFAIMFLLSSTWLEGVYDSLFYHHQQIKWNELYAAVPGLGNLDDRFAFNSNYLLISAIFSFRFLFGEAIFSLIPLSFIIIGCWIIKQLFESTFGFKQVIIFVAFAAFTTHSVYFIFDTSTDLLPNLICFYIIARVIIYPDFITKNNLFCFIIPIFLITCKLSVAPFCILTLYCVYRLIKNKNYPNLVFLSIFSLSILTPWLIRNIIISGYLIYPIASIDLFHFDWKIPKSIAVQQQAYITEIGRNFLHVAIFNPAVKYRDPLWINILTTATYICGIILFTISLIKFFKKKYQLHTSHYLLLTISISTIVVWLISGPDIRFISGIIFAFPALLLTTFFNTKTTSHFVRLGTASLFMFCFIIGGWSIRRIYYTHRTVVTSIVANHKPFADILITPYTEEEKIEIYGINIEDHFQAHRLNNNITIYISDLMYTLEILPSTVDKTIPGKYMDYRDIEVRGESLQDGFRVKKDSLYKYQ